MKKVAAVLFAGVMVATLRMTPLRAAEQTWVGEISDSACGMKHESGAENVPTPPAKECVAACVKGGSTYVIVVGDKVLEIANQNVKGLAELAGSKVKITGEAKGDVVTVSKIEKAD
jgi:hypothetical protein